MYVQIWYGDVGDVEVDDDGDVGDVEVDDDGDVGEMF